MGWLVDLAVLVVLALFFLLGWKLGLVRGLLGFAGLVLGAGLTRLAAVPLLRDWSAPAQLRLFIAVAVLIVLGGAGLIGGASLGGALQRRAQARERGRWNRAGGGIAGVFVGLLLSWSVGASLLAYPNQQLHQALTASHSLQGVDAILPDEVIGALRDVQSGLSQRGLPQLVGGFAVLPDDAVPLPSESEAITPAVKRSLPSVVRIYGVAQACGVGFTGSGFVSSAAHVITNAHVVAAMATPLVATTEGGQALPAKVVLFDPKVDIAVLYVPGLMAKPLTFDPHVRPGFIGAIAGYPGGGSLTASPARVEAELTDELALGTDIYGQVGVIRTVLLIAGQNAPGNSGGPFLTTEGLVGGLMSAQRAGEEPSAFALAVEELAPAVARSSGLTNPVDTGPCPN